MSTMPDEEYERLMDSLLQGASDLEKSLVLSSAGQRESERHVLQLQKDLDSTRAKFNEAKVEVKTMEKKTGQILTKINSSKKRLGTLDTESHTLSQATELLKKQLTERSSQVIEKKSFFDNLEADARSKMDEYQAWYDSFTSLTPLILKQDIEKLDPSIENAAEGVPAGDDKGGHVVERFAAGNGWDDLKLKRSLRQLEEENKQAARQLERMAAERRPENKQAARQLERIAAERRLSHLQDESQQATRQLERVAAESAQLETQIVAFERDLGKLQEEEVAEENYMQSLYDGVGRLQEYSQEVVCGSCAHAFVIECDKDSKLVVREAVGENLKNT